MSSDPLPDLDALVAEPVCQRLFRLFLVFADDKLTHEQADGRLLRYISECQSKFLIAQIVQIKDQMQIHPDRPSPSVHSEGDVQLLVSSILADQLSSSTRNQDEPSPVGNKITFRQLLVQILRICPSMGQLNPLIDRLFARYVQQIVRKGFLLCRRHRSLPRLLAPFRCCLLPASLSPADRIALFHRRRRSSAPCLLHSPQWRLFWCVLMPGQLNLWPLMKTGRCDSKFERQQREMAARREREARENHADDFCGEKAKWALRLPGDTRIELCDDDKGNDQDGEEQRLHSWLLATRTALFQFAHFDQLQRHLWIADLELVTSKRRASLLLQFDRSNSRQITTSRDEQGKGSRQTAEKHWQQPTQEQATLTSRSPSQTECKLREQLLDRENHELMQLLKAERQALEDEETVRQLATRMLDEEAQRADSLRETVQFLVSELEAERQQRIRLQQSLREYRQFSSSLNSPVACGQSESAENIALGHQGGDSAEEEEEEECEQGAKNMPMLLVPPERHATPVPRPKKGKTLRNSIKQKRREQRRMAAKMEEEEKVAATALIGSEPLMPKIIEGNR